MLSHSTQQSNAESRPLPAQNLAENLPSLGELVPVDSFFNRYITLLGVGRQPGAGQGTDSSAPSMQSQASNYQGQQGQPGQPTFRYPTTANYLAQLTGHDLHKQGSQVRSSLPVEQLDTGMQHRHMNGQPGPHGQPLTSGQPDLLSYPSSSLGHFQQLLQAQAGNPNGIAAQQLDPHSQGMHQSAALQAAHQAAMHAGQQQHQWFAPKAAAALAPPSDKTNQDPIQNNKDPNQNNRDPNRPALSPSRYGSSSRRGPAPNAGSPTSWANKPQQDQKSRGPVGNLGNGTANGDDISDMEDEGQSTGSRMPSDAGNLSRTNRTPRQQMQNKQAQQRYRERRKMKVTEMEQALAAMSQQVDELQGVLKQNVALQDKTLRLEHMLTERESKIEQLSAQLKAGRATSAQPSMPNQDMAGKDSGPNDDDGRCQSTPAFDGMSDLKLEFQGQIMKLQQYIEANNLRHVDPLGTSVPKEVLAHVTDMVEDGCRVCRRVQAEGLQVLSLITRDPQSLSELATAQEREKWSAAVRAVKLTPLQVEQVLIWREEHLKNIIAVYEQRQQLNVETINKMPDADGVPAKRLEAIQTDGYLPTAKANLELTECIDKVKENLRWEQRTVLQFNWVLVNRIMSPIQTALFMVHAWPSHCDCLALVNTISVLKNELLSTPSGASGSPSSQHSIPQAGLTDPMDTDIRQAPLAAVTTPQASTTPQGSPLQAGFSAAAAPEAASAAHPQGQAQAAAVTQQVVPFASAFRPVLPTKRDSNISRSPLPSSNPTSAFHPVGSSSRPGGSLPIQTQPSANAALPEPPQPGSEATESPATAREQQRQRSPQQEAQPAV